ncbi:MAG: hypothetical protein PARBB_00798 [Parabacteroides distasonis]
MNNNKNIGLLISSCDKYQTAWKPYFELIKRFWPQHPQKIYLNTETRSFSCEGLNIINMYSDKKTSWSKRLLNVLEQIPTKYILFSLEDAFLLGSVKQDIINTCIDWMEENSQIAECRLSAHDCIESGSRWKDSDFRVIPKEHAYRVDTQVAIWDRKKLISLIDETENPWEFEKNASKRARKTDWIFLWHYQTDKSNLAQMPFPYFTTPHYGYGIAWGHWLWKNKSWFNKNGISDINYNALGSLSERSVHMRFKYLYAKKVHGVGIIIRYYLRITSRGKILFHNLTSLGLQEGLKQSLFLLAHKLTK